MKLRTVWCDQWRVCSPISTIIDEVGGQPLSVIEVFLNSLENQYCRSAEGMLRLFKLASSYREGPRRLNDTLCHEARKGSGIYQFVKGDLRVFFFTDGNHRIMVCGCGVIKKRQKADPQKVAEAIRIKGEYEAAKQGGYLIIDGKRL